MSTSTVLQLEEYRGRRQQRRDTTLALYSSDAHRAELLRHLWRGMTITDADRGSILWLDEYGPGIVHPHVVLDVAMDRPRRLFALDLLRRTWEQGVPGVLDIPDSQREGILRLGDTTRSSFSVALGSDGVRAWFMVLDSLAPRAGLDDQVCEELHFLAGEAAAVLLHKDMDGVGRGEDRRAFTAWPVLRDVEGREEDKVLGHRISCRFLVTRAVRLLLDEDLAVDQDDLAHRIDGLREEIGDVAPCPERHLWIRVLNALEAGSHRELAAAVLALGVEVESQGHWSGAAELHRTAHELAAAVGATTVGVDAARFLARVFRRQGEWDEALSWYAIARSSARSFNDLGREAVILDGITNVHINQGDLPSARDSLAEAEDAAGRSDDAYARGSVYGTAMNVAHTAGELEKAARYGWMAFKEHQGEEHRLQTLTALGGVFLEARELPSAEAAFVVVAERVKSQVYRLYALHGLSIVSAFSGDRREFEERISELQAAGFHDGPPDFKAESYLERGDGYLHLGDEDQARKWYRRAIVLSEKVGANEFLIRAEEALARLERVSASPDGKLPPEPPFLREEEIGQIRGELQTIRDKVLAGSSIRG